MLEGSTELLLQLRLCLLLGAAQGTKSTSSLATEAEEEPGRLNVSGRQLFLLSHSLV